MAVTLRFTLDAQAPRSALRAAADRGQNLRPALRSMARAGVNQTKLRFESTRAPDGSPWKPSRKPFGRTLTASPRLLLSITDRPPSDTAVEWGSNLVYAGVHQEGDVIRAKTSKGLRFRVGSNKGWVTKQEVTIPARPYLGVNAENAAEMGAILVRYVFAPLGGAA